MPDMVMRFRVRSLCIERSSVQTFPSLSLIQEEQKPSNSKGITAPYHQTASLELVQEQCDKCLSHM